jgi:hypothetical protein
VAGLFANICIANSNVTDYNACDKRDIGTSEKYFGDLL